MLWLSAHSYQNYKQQNISKLKKSPILHRKWMCLSLLSLLYLPLNYIHTSGTTLHQVPSQEKNHDVLLNIEPEDGTDLCKVLKSSPQRKHSGNSELKYFSHLLLEYIRFWFAAENKKYFQLKVLLKVPHFTVVTSIDDKNTSWEVFVTAEGYAQTCSISGRKTLISREIINKKLYYYPVHDWWCADYSQTKLCR